MQCCMCNSFYIKEVFGLESQTWLESLLHPTKSLLSHMYSTSCTTKEFDIYHFHTIVTPTTLKLGLCCHCTLCMKRNYYLSDTFETILLKNPYQIKNT